MNRIAVVIISIGAMILTCRSQLLQMDGPYCSGVVFHGPVVLSFFRWMDRIAAMILTCRSQLLQMDGPYCSDDYFKRPYYSDDYFNCIDNYFTNRPFFYMSF